MGSLTQWGLSRTRLQVLTQEGLEEQIEAAQAQLAAVELEAEALGADAAAAAAAGAAGRTGDADADPSPAQAAAGEGLDVLDTFMLMTSSSVVDQTRAKLEAKRGALTRELKKLQKLLQYARPALGGLKQRTPAEVAAIAAQVPTARNYPTV
jgi:hypothetical protein